MLYKTNYDLPSHMREPLSESARRFYRIAFNLAIQWYGEELKKASDCFERYQEPVG